MPDIPKTMRAVVYRGVNDLRLETVPVPRIGPNELLVKVHATTVNRTDCEYRRAKPFILRYWTRLTGT